MFYAPLSVDTVYRETAVKNQFVIKVNYFGLYVKYVSFDNIYVWDFLYPLINLN
jgi:hypothetical protein